MKWKRSAEQRRLELCPARADWDHCEGGYPLLDVRDHLVVSAGQERAVGGASAA